MTCELVSVKLTDIQKSEVCGILAVGCDRQTAANYLGCSLADIRRAMERDVDFSRRVCRAEAGVEVNHMRNVQETAKKDKNWRASVWWLERRSPERYGSRSAGVVTTRQLKAIIAILIDMLGEEIRDDADRQRISARFNRVVERLDEMLHDMQPGPLESSFTEIESLLDMRVVSSHDGDDVQASLK